ncbi:MAG: hypothetical protein ACK553_12725 [Planctomycetota bacterium]|jgi:hypothetical protein
MLGTLECNALCCESVQGTSLEDWPSDPPLQQLVLETCGSPAKPVAFGVGMSGSGHWSLAAEVIGGPVDRIQFDWACRIQRPAAQLRSTYRMELASPRDPVVLTDQRGEWRMEDGSTLAVRVSEGRLTWRREHGLLSIEPTSDIQSLGTHCWRYGFSVE